MNTRVVRATEFKTKCLALLDEVEREGVSITVTKRGKPLATLQPFRKKPRPLTEGLWMGKVHFPDDRLTSDTAELWDIVGHESPET